MNASDLAKALLDAIEEHGDMEILVHAEDGWNYVIGSDVDKIYDMNGQRDVDEEENGNFNAFSVRTVC